MQQKKAYYILKAIQCWCSTVKEILEFVKDSNYNSNMFDFHVREIVHELRKYGYITKVKFWRQLKFWILKHVSKQSEIKLDNIE